MNLLFLLDFLSILHEISKITNTEPGTAGSIIHVLSTEFSLSLGRQINRAVHLFRVYEDFCNLP